MPAHSSSWYNMTRRYEFVYIFVNLAPDFYYYTVAAVIKITGNFYLTDWRPTTTGLWWLWNNWQPPSSQTGVWPLHHSDLNKITAVGRGPVEGVVPGNVDASLCSPKGAPRDAKASIVEAREGPLEAPCPWEHGWRWHHNILHHDHPGWGGPGYARGQRISILDLFHTPMIFFTPFRSYNLLTSFNWETVICIPPT